MKRSVGSPASRSAVLRTLGIAGEVLAAPTIPERRRMKRPERRVPDGFMSARKPKRFDVLGLGCAAVDDLLYVPCFPAADEKVHVQRNSRRFGGLTGVALVAASRAGARCAYAGCLGTDELSGYVAGYLGQEGVDLSYAPRLPQARVVHSIVVVGMDTGSRNVFFEGSGMIGAHDTQPSDEIIRACRVLFIDQWGMAGNLRAARVARLAGAAVVADVEDAGSPLFRQVLDVVDHLVLGEKFALDITGERDAAGAARALWRGPCRGDCDLRRLRLLERLRRKGADGCPSSRVRCQSHRHDRLRGCLSRCVCRQPGPRRCVGSQNPVCGCRSGLESTARGDSPPGRIARIPGTQPDSISSGRAEDCHNIPAPS